MNTILKEISPPVTQERVHPVPSPKFRKHSRIRTKDSLGKVILGSVLDFDGRSGYYTVRVELSEMFEYGRVILRHENEMEFQSK